MHCILSIVIFLVLLVMSLMNTMALLKIQQYGEKNKVPDTDESKLCGVSLKSVKMNYIASVLISIVAFVSLIYAIWCLIAEMKGKSMLSHLVQ
jgi:hypothetical protein